ncbi:MAG: 23S rRNA (adenine(2503)-C(2))-methyltransferase RlmN [Thermoanaerobaculia bacterium]
MSNARSLLELTPAELAVELVELGEPAYRADQVLRWVFKDQATDFEAMTNLSKELRSRLAVRYGIDSGHEVARSEAPDGTVKLLLAWQDGATTECVMIPAPDDERRRTLCVSTQVGCDVGCRFCASGIEGSLRNLSVGEVLGQALAVSRLLSGLGESLTNVVFMGMGEPLANYKTTVEAVRRLNAEWGFGIGQRKITISTVGLPKQIVRLAGEGLQTTLALSLHAANEELRAELIPWSRRLPLGELLDACRVYLEKTGREITLEYCLLAGVNDRERDLDDLARVARRLQAHVNLMMYNAVEGLPFERPQRSRALAFLNGLRKRGANAHLRESRGIEAEAACGQLRRRAG